MTFEKQYTVTEAAEILRLTRRTIFTYIYAGKIKAAKVGNKWIIPESQIKQFIPEN